MDYIQQLADRYPKLALIQNDIQQACDLMIESFAAGGKLLIAGNGGSAADAEHIVGELMKGFVKERKSPAGFFTALKNIDPESADYLYNHIQCGLPAIALNVHTALNTACINDIDGNIIYAQQVYGYGNRGDVFLGISTSGNSKDILYAAISAKAKGLKTIALSGSSGGSLIKYSDVSLIVPETETYKIQDLHLPVYHAL
jgi:D-sedoheptulose 7-phosphate isomerase